VNIAFGVFQKLHRISTFSGYRTALIAVRFAREKQITKKFSGSGFCSISLPRLPGPDLFYSEDGFNKTLKKMRIDRTGGSLGFGA